MDTTSLSSLITMALTKRQNSAPMPQGHFGRDSWYAPRWAMILSAVLAGIFILTICICILFTVFRRRRTGTSSADIKRSIAHQRRMSGITDSDPDNIKPVKRLRSFHMKGAISSPDTTSPRTPKGANAGLFSRFFRKKDGKRLPPLDEERTESYSSLNAYPETPALDEKMLEASPPPTPAPAFGWSSNVGPGGQPRPIVDRSGSTPAPPYSPQMFTSPQTYTGSGVGEQNTAYKGDVRPPMGQRESDSFLQTSERTSRDAKRLSTDYNENYQSRPSGGLFDDDDDERRPLGYNPDSRSGH